MIINNNYEIIKIERTTKQDTQEKGIALGKAISPKQPSQYVTWRYVKDNNEFYFYSGNYFAVEKMAYKDFYKRLMDEYE